MKRLQELANEYLKGERDARAFRSALLAIVSMLNDADTDGLARALRNHDPNFPITGR